MDWAPAVEGVWCWAAGIGELHRQRRIDLSAFLSAWMARHRGRCQARLGEDSGKLSLVEEVDINQPERGVNKRFRMEEDVRISNRVQAIYQRVQAYLTKHYLSGGLCAWRPLED